MARSLWKGPFVDVYLFKKSKKMLISSPGNQSNGRERHETDQEFMNSSVLKHEQPRGPIRVWSRRSLILPEFIDQFYEIYNGKQFISFQVNEDMVGHKFGEFAATRKKTLHKKKIQK